MKRRRRGTALFAALALVAAIVAAFYWQNIALWLRPAPPEKLTLAVIDTYIGSGLVHIAAAKGYFAAEGLAVTLQPHSGGRTALDAVIKNKADVTTVGNMPLMFATLNRTPVAIVATIASAFRSAGIVARRDRGVSAPADLKGKTVGVTHGTDAPYLLNVILAGHGLAPADIRTVDTKPEAMVAALSAGQVDAIATWEPILSLVKKALGPVGFSIDLDRGFAVGFHLAGKPEFVRNRPATVQKLLRSLWRAERFIDDNPAAASTIVAEATRLDPGLFEELRPNFRLHLSLPQGLLTTLEDQALWAIANRYTEATEVPNFLDIVYLDGMLAVRPETVSIIR